MDNKQNILGINSADNQFVSDLVVANADGSSIERLEYIQAQMVVNASSAPRCIEKSDGGVLNGADPLFTITGAPVYCRIFGIVTTLIVGAANGTLQITTTAPVGTTALSTTVAINDDAVGTSYRFVGATGVLTPVTAGAVIVDPVTVGDCWFLAPIGELIFLGSAARAGNIKWYMEYIPLSSSSVVTVAA